jgi:hypothetical protein
MRPKGDFRSIRCLRFQCEVLHIGGEEERRGQDILLEAHLVLKRFWRRCSGMVPVGPKQDF